MRFGGVVPTTFKVGLLALCAVGLGIYSSGDFSTDLTSWTPELASPWIFLVFLGGRVAGARRLAWAPLVGTMLVMSGLVGF